MKEFLKVYEEHQEEIERFIISTLQNNGSILIEAPSNYKKVFSTFPSMELLYITDQDFKQTSPNVLRKKTEVSSKGKDRKYLSSKVTQKEDEFSISQPYISSSNGRMCITVMKKEDDKNIFIDFGLAGLLGRLGLVELHPTFNTFTKSFYIAVGFSLMAFAFIAVVYALLGYLSHLFIEHNFSLEGLFKPIVALTLGLAIFDLAKTILEREVFFKNYAKEDEDAKVLTKFSIAIIIALSIEALMVVFKIALHDYSQMVHALYLIIGIALIILSLGIYSYLSKKVN